MYTCTDTHTHKHIHMWHNVCRRGNAKTRLFISLFHANTHTFGRIIVWWQQKRPGDDDKFLKKHITHIYLISWCWRWWKCFSFIHAHMRTIVVIIIHGTNLAKHCLLNFLLFFCRSNCHHQNMFTYGWIFSTEPGSDHISNDNSPIQFYQKM